MEEKTEKEVTAPSNQIKITDILFITLRRWPLLILSIAIFVGMAVFYILRTAPVYTRSASIVIKSSSTGNSISDISAFSEMGLVQTSSNINDDINKLQSPDVMDEVVRRLGLDKSYSTDGRFHNEILYGSSLPLTVEFPTLTESESGAATLLIDAGGHIQISDIVLNGQTAITTPVKVTPGDTIRTPHGNLIVRLTGRGNLHESTIFVSKRPLSSASAYFLGELTVALKNNTGNTINLSAIDYSPERAVDLLNGVIAVYNEKWIEDRNQVSVSTANFINERLAVIENELGGIDKDIASYQSEHLIPDIQQAASMYMSENQAASAQLLDLNNQLQMTRYMRKHIDAPESKNQMLPINTGIPGVESLIGQYNTLMLERNQKAEISSASHPVIANLDNKLSELRASIVSSIDNQATVLETQMRNLKSSKSATTAQLAAAPIQGNHLLSVERQQKVKESLYLFLLQKREENELSQAFTAYNTEVIKRPSGSNVPTAPVRDKIIMIAFAFGLILPFGVTYLLETSDTKIRGRKDIETLTIPFLGEIPDDKPDKGESKDSRIVVKPGKRNVINEAFRVLRTNLGFLTSGNTTSIAMVTSFNPGSGKTFITMNTAISLVIKGKKVVVIDGDMRRGSTSAYINSPATGLSNYLVGETDRISEIIYADTIVPGLSVIPVGTIPPNPTELLESPRLAKLIDTLKADYDYILIDCPPVEMMADAQIIETLVDRTIFVIRAGLFERSMLPDLQNLYNMKKYRNMSLVLNATAADGSRRGYRYGYGYGYGYGNYSHYTPKK